jgi:hypothetical protein
MTIQNIYQLALKIPGQGNTSSEVPVPSGIPAALTGGLNTTGQSFIQLFFNYLFMGATLITLVMIIYSGIQWTTSQGDPDKIAAARSRLMYAIIGLVVVACSFLIVRLIITILGGNPSSFVNVK